MSLKTVMDSIPEVMVISDTGSKSSNCSIYDLKSGNLISTYEEGHSIPKGLSFIADEYLISAFKDKPCLKVWTLSKSHKEDCKMTCPGKVTALAVSRCGEYCIAGIEKSIYFWEVSTGELKNSLQYHSQDITCLRFTADGSHFLSGGKDGMVLVWVVPEIISSSPTYQNIKPRFTWMNHSSEVTDIFIGNMGVFARVVTVSKDMTCRIYELQCGKLLITICVDYEITAAVMNESEYFLYLGCNEGHIYRINLFLVRDNTVQHIRADTQKSAFIGHIKPITSLSLSLMGKFLLSGSEDGCCRVWDTTNFTCMRTLPFEGIVTNAFIAFRSSALSTNGKCQPKTTVSAFKRHFDIEHSGSYFLPKMHSRKQTLTQVESDDKYFDMHILNASSESLESLNKTKVSQKDLTVINTQLYSYALSEALSQIKEEQLTDD